MWFALGIPLMLLACAIAMAPVLYGTHRRNWHPELIAKPVEPFAPTARQVEVTCPPCGEVVRASGHEALLAALHEHAWTRHGVPHSESVLRSTTITIPGLLGSSTDTR
jgi:hypothetical protein